MKDLTHTRNMARFFVENRHVSWVLLVAVLAWGAFGYAMMPERKDPDIPVRVAAVLSLGSSAVSALLAFYLTFVGAYSALTPVSMLLYLLLWALAALIEGFWADRY